MQRKEYVFKPFDGDIPIAADVYYRPEWSDHLACKGIGSPSLRISFQTHLAYISADKNLAILLHGGGFVIGSKDSLPQA